MRTPGSPRTRTRLTLAALSITALAAASCGGDDDDATAATDGARVTTTAAAEPATTVAGSAAETTASESDSTATAGSAAAGDLASQLPAEIIERGKIVSIMQTPAPPFEFTDEATGELTGIDVDFVNALSELIGFPIETPEVSDFAALIPSVQSGRADMAMSGMLDKLERQELGDFVDYLRGGTSFWAVTGSGLTEHADFCGKTVVTGAGTDYVQQIEALSTEICPTGTSIEILALSGGGFAGNYNALKQGRADGIVIGPDFAGYEVANNYPGELEMIGDIFNPNVYGIFVNKDLPELRDVMEQAMIQLYEDGTYDEILEKWGQSGSAVDAITVNSATS